MSGKAPITETLAASLIMLTPWNKDRILVDPFCGSGTFPIEAAMMAANIAPGMNRSFTAESWKNIIPKKVWYDTIDEANDLIQDDVKVDIQGYDLDSSVIKIARRNAREAGVDHLIHFQERDVKDLHHPKKYGFVITNPPYGERLEDKKDLPALYRAFGESFKHLDSWSAYMITSYEEAERYFDAYDKNPRFIMNVEDLFLSVPWTETAKKAEGEVGKTRGELKMDTIIFATGNKNKMIEIRMILADLGCKICPRKKPESRRM